MADVKILVCGYVSEDAPGKEERTCPTITLVRDKGLIMVVDPGTVKSTAVLADALKKQGLSFADVNAVFLTHSHIDHFRNIGLFPAAEVIEYYGIWKDDTSKKRKDALTADVRIRETPGHNYTSLTLLVKTDKGTVAVCGDVFWKKGYPAQDPYADDALQLATSRKKILELADFIIPGHGEMFTSKK